MTGSPSSTLREAGTSRPSRRRLGRRLSATHVLTAVVVILAFVLNLLVLQDRNATLLVAVVHHRVQAGSTFDRDDIGLEPVDSNFSGVSAFVSAEDLESLEGHVFTRTVPAGSPLMLDDLGSPGASDGLRTMSVPVAVEHAAGGSLVEGDVVDVISVMDDVAAFVATGLEVVGVSDQSAGAIGTPGGYHITLAVDTSQALALASALDNGSIEIIKATGAGSISDEVDDAP